MTQPIAIINGTQVFSNKQVNSIINSRVNFTDGSWCDVRTGEVVNNGTGYISIGTPGTSSGPKVVVTMKSKRFTAQKVWANNLTANLKIETHADKDVEVVLKGQEADLENITMTERDGTLLIEGKVSKFGGTRISTGRNNVIISGVHGVIGNIVGSSINITGGETDTLITVKVPKGTALAVEDVHGDTVIGDTEGQLKVSVTSGNLKAGRVGNADLIMKGNGDIDVAEVNGTLNMQLTGNGDITVEDGTVTMLMANLMGNGDIRFNGKAQDANLTLMGNGDLKVKHVTNRPNKNKMGNGSLKVSNW